ncbi:MAG: hypothetical protein A3E80_05880 [Chlamydiae bacterium RIFCSPHIGHO2_12_FULL_49_9]|nr:MAG: hypothetical protein A3E80_05880 [Chlamydiae bacterium RIFCSPHIGHO2_12_FULL_49_9]
MFRFFLGFSLAATSFLSAELMDSNIAARPFKTKHEAPKDAIPQELRSHIQAGINYTWAEISPDGPETTSGSLGGLQAEYEYRAPSLIYGALTFAWRQGNTTGEPAKRSMCYIDAQERIGYTFHKMRERVLFSLFTGLGYRHHGEDVKSSPTATPVTFDYNHLYVPLGWVLDAEINPTVSLGFDFQWMPQVYPTVKIDPINGARWIITYELGNFKVSLPITIHPRKDMNWFVTIEPSFEYWKDGRTTAVTETGVALSVPENTNLFGGLNVNAGYSF